MSERVAVTLHWMIRRDMPEVLRIEAESFELPWTHADFVRCLLRNNRIGLVAEHDGRVVGFLLYEIQPTHFELVRMAVAPSHRRRLVGSCLVGRLKGRLQATRRDRIVVVVRETNLAAQLFFRAAGLRATRILRNFYRDTGEDGYRMEFRLSWPSALGPPRRGCATPERERRT